ncbi:MAG: hypothetical protein ABI210_14600, partial [Abditibacteriaceae bacterium]
FNQKNTKVLTFKMSGLFAYWVIEHVFCLKREMKELYVIPTFPTREGVEVRQMLSLLKSTFDKASTSLSLTICTNTEHEPSWFILHTPGLSRSRYVSWRADRGWGFWLPLNRKNVTHEMALFRCIRRARSRR